MCISCPSPGTGRFPREPWLCPPGVVFEARVPGGLCLWPLGCHCGPSRPAAAICNYCPLDPPVSVLHQTRFTRAAPGLLRLSSEEPLAGMFGPTCVPFAGSPPRVRFPEWLRSLSSPHSPRWGLDRGSWGLEAEESARKRRSIAPTPPSGRAPTDASLFLQPSFLYPRWHPESARPRLCVTRFLLSERTSNLPSTRPPHTPCPVRFQEPPAWGCTRQSQEHMQHGL